MQFNSPVSDNLLVMKGFPGGSVIKNPPANAGDPGDTGLIPGWEDSLKEEVAIHSSILAWKIPWTEEPGGLQSRESHSQTLLKQLNSSSRREK